MPATRWSAYDGVTGVGYTYFEPAPSTGAIAGSAGFGIETQGHLDNSWNRANFGLKVALPVGDGDTGPRVRGRLGVFYEDLKTSASGNTQLTYNGSPYAGYSQQWDLDAKDRYYGIRTGVHIGFKPQFDGKLKTSIGGDLYLGYHSGEGSYQQYSQAGGAADHANGRLFEERLFGRRGVDRVGHLRIRSGLEAGRRSGILLPAFRDQLHCAAEPERAGRCRLFPGAGDAGVPQSPADAQLLTSPPKTGEVPAANWNRGLSRVTIRTDRAPGREAWSNSTKAG